jgi:hypothetical protein
VNAHDVITAVSPLWLAFARENGAVQLTSAAVIGRSLWDFIDGVATKQFYQAILQRVRTTTVRVILPFRCDSPTLRRYMRLEITRQPQNGIQFEGVLERVEPVARLNLLDPTVRRSGDTLTLCSGCKRALVETVGWLEIEDAAVRLRLLEGKDAPQLRNTVCPRCLAAADVSFATPKLGDSAGCSA